MALTKNITIKKFLFLLVIILAIFFRLWKLDSIPPGLYPDEAINGNEAFESLKTKNFKLFYPENNGREGLFIWFLSLSFSIFGVSIWSLRLVPALSGIFTVIGVYFLTKELFCQDINYKLKAENLATFSSFLTAVSFWHVNFSRIGFRAILTPLCLVFSFYFLFKGFRTKKILNLIAGGIFFGLGFYTYISFRLAVIFLALTLFIWLLIYKKQNIVKNYIFLVSCFLLSTFVTALPMGIYFLQNPEDFMGRATPISIFSAENPAKEFLKSLVLHLGMFNLRGDANWRHNLSKSPQLLFPAGILFLIGIISSLKELIKSIKNRNYEILNVHSLYSAWFLIMMLPGMLTQEGVPHALRVIGVIPVVYIFASMGGFHLFNFLQTKIKNKKFICAVLYISLIALTAVQLNKYFFSWGKNQESENAFSKDYVKIGNLLNSFPKDTQKIVIVNRSGVRVPLQDGIPMPSQTVMFMENSKFGKIQSMYLLPDEIDKIKIDKKSTIIVPLGYEQQLFEKLQKMFPQGKVEKQNEILIFKI